MILIDTNVLLRSAQPNHSHCVVAKEAVKTVVMRGYIPCIVPQIIYEYWVVATRPADENGLGMPPGEAHDDISKIIDQFHCLRDERAVFDHWLELVKQFEIHGKSAHDTRIVAAMQRHGVAILLTFNDKDFQRYTDIHVVHPNNAASLTLKE